MNRIRQAGSEDCARIAEIEIFNYRLHFYPIFRNDNFYFDELQVPALAEEHRQDRDFLRSTYVYDDGVVKGFIRMDGQEVCKLFVEPVLQGQGIGTALLAYAVREKDARFLWALEKNTRAIAFYQRHGFVLKDQRKPEEDTTEYLVRMERPLFSRCGMRCDLCLIYRPNVEKEDRRADICAVWKKIWQGFDPDPQTVICDGCCCEHEAAVRFSPDCEARKCVKAKGHAHCGECGEYPCSIFPAEPTPEETARMIDVEGRWTWEDEKLMAAYACKANMDALRSTEGPHRQED